MAEEIATKKKANKTPIEGGNLEFEAWEMLVNINTESRTAKRTFEKWKLLRPRVRISAAEAETLNTPFAGADNRSCTLYLLPGEKKLLTVDEINYEPIKTK